MDLMSPAFWESLATIIFIDLILAGDNAIVIGMAAGKLPESQQKKAILWGTFGAVAIRIVATVFFVWLMRIPGLQLAGGLLLTWIAYKLLVNEEDHKEIEAKDSLFAAIRTIVVADAAMGFDNMIAVAGAAHGNPLLVAIGLIVSVPIVVWGSTLFISLTNKFPQILYLGSGVLAYTAAKMITHDGLVGHWFASPYVYWAFVAALTTAVLVAGKVKNVKKAEKPSEQPSKS